MPRIGDHLDLLDILHEDSFEGQIIDPEIKKKTEVNFYRGAPPQWLNFYLDEQNKESNRLIKRDGYEELRGKILSKKFGVQCVRLNHEPGSGGTTLAMQLLWDLRSSFRCAVLVDPTSDDSEVATQVTELYTAGEPKTVLLLVQDQYVDTLQKSIVEELSKMKTSDGAPAVVILHCVRMALIDTEDINLRKELSAEETIQFDAKKEQLRTMFPKEHEHFHGFNIMQSNFSQDYVQRSCQVFNNPDLKKKNRGLQLSACMCLLNGYVPGSFLLARRCNAFLQTKIGELTIGDIKEPFRHLMVSFEPLGGGEEHVRMAHPMIAEQGNRKMSSRDAGGHIYDTARVLLSELCQEDVTQSLTGFITHLLTKRDKHTNGQGKKANFSKLIVDIRNRDRCVSVLKEAIDAFPQIAILPQTLSRFYNIISDFINAEKWAKEAQHVEPQSDFTADTLARVYMRQLISKLKELPSNPQILPEILLIAKNAFTAFENEENLAEEERSMREDWHLFNVLGKSGYLQVANILFDSKDILTGQINDKEQYSNYTNLTRSLPEEIKKRATFIQMILCYSKKSFTETDPPCLLKEAKKCYKNYTGDALPDATGTPSYQEKYFRSRYLLPIGNLVNVQGVVRNYKVYTTQDDKETELHVEARQLGCLRSFGRVSFDLGLTVRGPTAYNIQYQEELTDEG
ncbi:hypothetical protein NHX12_013812 [Muraenolepis orangiensis]|uniref:Sterile alpha motif domain-containing protein 9-like n=1 Tax=Muraenolepis orangiensis TaxID=630683 RepID=A0A9Q0DAT6_9TELE|nr:hypothetical protein NHX12_013812 [Muraenolepis orangiensis]